jgi:hypothetical protein
MKLLVLGALLVAPIFAQHYYRYHGDSIRNSVRRSIQEARQTRMEALRDARRARVEAMREASRARIEARRAIREAMREAFRDYRGERRWRM